MRIMSCNVRIWTRDKNPFSKHFWMKRASALNTMLNKKDPDVILFQEWSPILKIYIPKGYKAYYNNTEIPIFVKDGIKVKTSCHKIFDTHSAKYERGYTKIDIDGYCIINVHTDWGDEFNAQAEELNNIVIPESENVVIGGDFNVNQETAEKVIKYTAYMQNDSMCTFHKWGEEHSKLDHFFSKESPNCFAIIENNVISDHYPVYIDF